MEVPTTSTPNGHHLPPILDGGPRGAAANGRTSTPFPRQPSESNSQRFTQTPTQAADGTCSSSAASLPGSAASPLPGGQHNADIRPRGPAAHQRPPQGVGGQPPEGPPPRAGRGDTGPGRRHRPLDPLGPYTTGSPPMLQHSQTPRARRTHRNNGSTTRAAQERGKEMTESCCPQICDSLPTAAACSMPQQREPSTGKEPGGHPDTALGHPSPTGATPDQDRETMPLPPPRPPQRGNTDPFDNADLRALYGIHATAHASGLGAALWEFLGDVNPNRLLAVVPMLHAATTDIFVRRLQALVTPGTQITDDLVDAWIWWFKTHQPDQGGIWVPQLGWADTLIAPPTNPRPAPSTGGRERAAP